MKKLLAIVLSLLMVMSLAVPAMAVENTATGTITVENAVKDVIYTAYRILDVETIVNNASDTAVGADDVKTDNNLVTYKVADGWANFFADGGAGKDYVVIGPQGYVTWNAGKSSAADVQAFAQAALVYATTNSIAGYNGTFTASDEDSETGTYAFANLPLGYYVIDSTLGTLCAIDTTTTNAVVKEKNEKPSITKDVQEDSTGNYGDINNADIGDVVNFKITVDVPKNSSDNIRVIDTMSSGLTFDATSVAVKVNDVTVDPSNYILTTNSFDSLGLGEGVNPIFVVDFTPDYIKTINSEATSIVIEYSATVNENAVIRGDGNPNEVDLKYGDNYKIDGGHDDTKTYVYDFLLKKYTTKNGEQVILAGAEFILKNKTTGKYATFTMSDDDYTYTLSGWVSEETGATTITSKETNRISIKGLDADEYELYETKVPAGYNKMTPDPAPVTLRQADGDLDNPAEDGEFVNVRAIENNSGSELPETGGIGTTIFYVVGGLMMAVAVVLLVTKKKVNGK